MKITDYIASLIRTVVPAGIGSLITYACAKWGIVIDEDTQLGFLTATAGFAVSAYYAIVRRAEAKWPWVGWLLGLAKEPEYKK